MLYMYTSSGVYLACAMPGRLAGERVKNSCLCDWLGLGRMVGVGVVGPTGSAGARALPCHD